MSALRQAAQQALEEMGSVGADWICEASNHAERDQHKVGEPCPLQQRWHVAYQALRAALAEPVQEPVAVVRWNDIGHISWRTHVMLPDDTPLYAAPPQRKPPATIDEMFDRMDKAPRGVFFGHDPMTIWMEAWRAAEQHHGIT